MSLNTYAIAGYGGLNLLSDPQQVGPETCIDIMNIDFDKPGRIRTRDGTENWSSVAATSIDSLFAINYGSRGLLTHRNAGTTVATGADFVQIGTPAAQYTYMTAAAFGGSGTFERYDVTGGAPTSTIAAAGQVQRWDGAAFSSPAGLAVITPMLLSRQSPDNRLVAANTTTNPSRVMFSDAGTPETFTAANFVDLVPGDGETITAVESWREQLFVFKQTKFFVFYGNSVSGTGTPIFNYRLVDAGVGCDTLLASCAADDGVYFAHRTGIYRTTGGPPERVSAPIDPLFRKYPDTIYATDLSAAVTHMTYIDGKILIGVADDTSTPGVNAPDVPLLTLVYSTRTRTWSVWDITAICYTGWVVAGPDEPTFMFSSVGNKVIRKHTPGLATDVGSAMAARYQTGFYEPSPGNEVTTRWSKLWGTGSPTFNIFTDDATSDPLSRGGTVTLGTYPQVAKGYHLKAYTGQYFSHKVSSTSGAWSLSRIEHDITNVFQPA